MKRISWFPLIGLVPILLGFCYVHLVYVPVVWALIPWCMTAVWLWAGWRCGRGGRGWLVSVLAGHWGVLLMVLCALWQYGVLNGAGQSVPLAVFAQYLVGLVPGVMRLLMPFWNVGGVIESTRVILICVPATAAALVLLFSAAFFLGKRAGD